MIEQSDFDAIERTIREWHQRQPRHAGLSAEQEQAMAEAHLQYLDWTRMWAQRAGVVAEQTQAEYTQIN